jgi:hypothetical protein
MALVVETTLSADTCKGYNFNLTTSSLAALLPPAGSRYALLTVEGQSLRYRCDGVAPTVSQGMLMVSGQSRVIAMNDWTKFQALQVTASSTLTAEFWGNSP